MNSPSTVPDTFYLEPTPANTGRGQGTLWTGQWITGPTHRNKRHTHKHIHAYGQFRVTRQRNVHVFGLWEEDGEARSCKTPPRKAPGPVDLTQSLPAERRECKLTTTPPCHPYVIVDVIKSHCWNRCNQLISSCPVCVPLSVCWVYPFNSVWFLAQTQLCEIKLNLFMCMYNFDHYVCFSPCSLCSNSTELQIKLLSFASFLLGKYSNWDAAYKHCMTNQQRVSRHFQRVLWLQHWTKHLPPLQKNYMNFACDFSEVKYVENVFCTWGHMWFWHKSHGMKHSNTHVKPVLFAHGQISLYRSIMTIKAFWVWES